MHVKSTNKFNCIDTKVPVYGPSPSLSLLFYNIATYQKPGLPGTLPV